MTTIKITIEVKNNVNPDIKVESLKQDSDIKNIEWKNWKPGMDENPWSYWKPWVPGMDIGPRLDASMSSQTYEWKKNNL